MEAKTTEPKKPIALSSPFYKIAYGAFLLLGLFFFIVKGDLSNSTIYFGLALVFDPFDQQVRWSNRPAYQKVWLITHLILLFGIFGYMIMSPVIK